MGNFIKIDSGKVKPITTQIICRKKNVHLYKQLI